jgi:hypothetical protein
LKGSKPDITDMSSMSGARIEKPWESVWPTGTPMHLLHIPQDADALLNEVQAADLLNLSIRTLQAWRAKRAGPDFVRAGRAIRYRRRDLVAWVETQVVSLRGAEERSHPPQADQGDDGPAPPAQG